MPGGQVMRTPLFPCPVREACYHEHMTTPIILPALDDRAREYACSCIEPLQGYFNVYPVAWYTRPEYGV